MDDKSFISNQRASLDISLMHLDIKQKPWSQIPSPRHFVQVLRFRKVTEKRLSYGHYHYKYEINPVSV